MSSIIDLSYGSPGAVTCSLTGLASGAARQSATVDNTSSLFIDVFIQVKIVYPNSLPSNDVVVYIASSIDGTDFDGNATGTDSTYAYSGSAPTGHSLVPIFPIQNATKYVTASMAFYNGFIPPKFSFVIVNFTPFALGTGSSIQYLGMEMGVG